MQTSTLALQQRQTGSETPRAIDTIIQNDHESFRNLYDRFMSSSAVSERQALANEFIREVATHSIAEELVLYPRLQKMWMAAQEDAAKVDQFREEHLEVKKALYDLDHMSVQHADYEPKLKHVMNSLNHHISEEEEDALRALRSRLTEDDLAALGDEFLHEKNMAPTRPHPSAPDHPPLETLAGLASAPMDKLRDLGRKFADRKVSQ